MWHIIRITTVNTESRLRTNKTSVTLNNEFAILLSTI